MYLLSHVRVVNYDIMLNKTTVYPRVVNFSVTLGVPRRKNFPELPLSQVLRTLKNNVYTPQRHVILLWREHGEDRSVTL